MHKFSRLRLFVLIAAIAFAFGGFTFYAAIVVPIGTEVLDARTQGFVTQQVTHRINIANAVLLLVLIWDGFAARKHRSKRVNRLFLGITALFTAALVFLVFLHPQMDRLLDTKTLSIAHPEAFYRLHRIYLWASTVQWLCTIGLIGIICRTNYHPGGRSNLHVLFPKLPGRPE